MGMRKLSWFANFFYRCAQAKPRLYFLIGPPAVGKSTWIQENAANAAICNRDDEVVAAAQETGVGTYDDMFERPPQDVIAGLNTPDKETIMAAEAGDEQAKAQVEQFLAELPRRAEEYRQTADPSKLQQFGDVIPFDYDELKKVIVDYGVPAQYVTPFEFSNIRSANELVEEKFDAVRAGAVEGGGDIVIDMTNLNKSSRDSHRKFIVAAKEGIDPGEADPNKVNEYYEQVAVVFASPEGYSPEEREQLKQVAQMRAEEIKAAGGAKTIPATAYDRMFDQMEMPQDDEGFVDVQYVGIPSLGRLAQASLRYRLRRFAQERFHEEEDVNGVQIIVRWDPGNKEYELYLPQADPSISGDQVVRLNANTEVAKKAFSEARKWAELGGTPDQIIESMLSYRDLLFQMKGEGDEQKDIPDWLQESSEPKIRLGVDGYEIHWGDGRVDGPFVEYEQAEEVMQNTDPELQ